MEWIKDLHGKTIGLDTAPLIYFIEENPAYIEKGTGVSGGRAVEYARLTAQKVRIVGRISASVRNPANQAIRSQFPVSGFSLIVCIYKNTNVQP